MTDGPFVERPPWWLRAGAALLIEPWGPVVIFGAITAFLLALAAFGGVVDEVWPQLALAFVGGNVVGQVLRWPQRASLEELRRKRRYGELDALLLDLRRRR